MTRLIWSDALSLCLPAMDDTHREFVDLLAAVEQAGDDHVLAAWQMLVDHTVDHFGQEDRWMRETGFAPGNCHSTQHTVVLQVMREGTKRGAAGELNVVREMAQELADWFPSHAQNMDAALALHLKSVGYDTGSGRITHPEQLPEDALTHCGGGRCGERAEAKQANAAGTLPATTAAAG